MTNGFVNAKQLLEVLLPVLRDPLNKDGEIIHNPKFSQFVRFASMVESLGGTAQARKYLEAIEKLEKYV